MDVFPSCAPPSAAIIRSGGDVLGDNLDDKRQSFTVLKNGAEIL